MEDYLEITENYDVNTGDHVSSTYMLPYEYTCLCDNVYEPYPAHIIETLNKFCTFSPPGTDPVYTDQLVFVTKKDDEVLEYTVRYNIPLSYFNHHTWSQFCDHLGTDHHNFYERLVEIARVGVGRLFGDLLGITYDADGKIKEYHIQNNQFDLQILKNYKNYQKLRLLWREDPKYLQIVSINPYNQNVSLEIYRETSSHVLKLDMSKEVRNVKIIYNKADFEPQKQEFLSELLSYEMITEEQKTVIDNVESKKSISIKFDFDESDKLTNASFKNLVVRNFKRL